MKIEAYNIHMMVYYFPYNYFHLVHDVLYPFHTWLVKKKLLDKHIFVNLDILGAFKSPSLTHIYKHAFDFLYPDIHFINNDENIKKYKFVDVSTNIKSMEFSKNDILTFKNYVLSKLDKNTNIEKCIIIIERENKSNKDSISEETKSVINRRWLRRESAKYIINIDELKERLEEYCCKKGLQLYVLKCENLSFEQQVGYFSKAVCVVAQQGAGAVNCLWMDEKSLFIEYLNAHYQPEFEFYKANSLNHVIIEYSGRFHRGINVDCDKTLEAIESNEPNFGTS